MTFLSLLSSRLCGEEFDSGQKFMKSLGRPKPAQATKALGTPLAIRGTGREIASDPAHLTATRLPSGEVKSHV